MPRRSARQNPLTTEEIAATSLAIVDRDGLSSLTMRALGKELGCDPMAIYRHVEDRDALLTLVSAIIIGEVVAPPADRDDRSWLMEFADAVRETFHRHPNAVILIGHNQLSAGVGLGLIEQLVARFGGDDLPGRLVDRVNAYLGALIGYITLELSPPSSNPHSVYLNAEAYPQLSANAEEVVGATFGLRSENAEIVALPGGFSLLMSVLIDQLTTPQTPGQE